MYYDIKKAYSTVVCTMYVLRAGLGFGLALPGFWWSLGDWLVCFGWFLRHRPQFCFSCIFLDIFHMFQNHPLLCGWIQWWVGQVLLQQKHLHTLTLLLLCFTVVLRFFSLNAVIFFLCQTRHLFWCTNNLNLELPFDVVVFAYIPSGLSNLTFIFLLYTFH